MMHARQCGRLHDPKFGQGKRYPGNHGYADAERALILDIEHGNQRAGDTPSNQDGRQDLPESGGAHA